MRRDAVYIRLLRSTLVVFTIGFGSSVVSADEPAGQPAPSSTVQEAQATPAEAGEVQTRAARGGANSTTRASLLGCGRCVLQESLFRPCQPENLH